MSDQNWTFWRSDLASPQDHNNVTEPGSGFWRCRAAKTKPDWPIAIWWDGVTPNVKVGNNLTTGDDALLEFLSGSTWLKATAVSHADYKQAIDTGKWPDGKPARHMDEAEKHDISTEPGDNAAPIEETLAEQIAAAVEKAQAITKITNADEARAANELADKLAALFKTGDAKRAEEKRPHDEAAKAVQAKWLPIITPATDARERLVGRGGLVKQWLKAEQDRIDREHREEKERQRQEAERIRQENEKAAAEAAEQGKDAPAPIPQPEPETPAVAPRAQAANSLGRATGLRKVTRAKITDMGKLLLALQDHREMREFAQTLANRAAKAGIPLDGMEIEETME